MLGISVATLTTWGLRLAIAAPVIALVLLALFRFGVMDFRLPLLGVALAVLLDVAKPEVIFSGFTSGTLWLVLGGLVIAEAMRMTGLGERVARAALGIRVWTYPQLVAAVVLVAIVLAFLLLPIVAIVPPAAPRHQ